MRRDPAIRAVLVALLLAVGAAAADPLPAPAINIANDAGVDPARVAALRKEFGEWGARVYRYLHAAPDAPVNLVLSRKAGPGFYVGDRILIAPDDDEMLETWVHELTHHVTGHDSSFFFKEGVATHVVEALFAEDHRVPLGWPQYGQTNDAWVNLFLLRGQMQSLEQAMGRKHYEGFPPEQDYRSWQIYCIGGSFVGWMIRTEGYAAFRKAFDAEDLGDRRADLERRWLDDIRRRQLAAFEPMDYLPDHLRYRAFANRLRESGK